jgi:hypothetical protein
MVDNMGSLKPGATYIYERNEGIIYAREMGANPQERFVVGYESNTDYDLLNNGINKYKENQLWHEIRSAAESNPALQEALDRVKVIYELSKDE